jgi:lipoprotein NlpI
LGDNVKQTILGAYSAIFLSIIGSAGVALADAQRDFDTCDDAYERDDWKKAISYCSKGLDSGDVKKKDQVWALITRGLAYNQLADYDAALKDLDRAAELDPENSKVFNDRGVVHSNKLQYDRAIQDFDQALKLDPDNENVFQNRGVAHFNLGHYTEASRDFKESLHEKPDHPYAALWLFVARKRMGEDGLAELKSEAEDHDLDRWPGPLLAYYLGSLSLADVERAAEDQDPKVKGWNLCELNFYVGEMEVEAKNDAAARASFEKAVAQCPPNFIEYKGARAELTRMSN